MKRSELKNIIREVIKEDINPGYPHLISIWKDKDRQSFYLFNTGNYRYELNGERHKKIDIPSMDGHRTSQEAEKILIKLGYKKQSDIR